MTASLEEGDGISLITPRHLFGSDCWLPAAFSSREIAISPALGRREELAFPFLTMSPFIINTFLLALAAWKQLAQLIQHFWGKGSLKLPTPTIVHRAVVLVPLKSIARSVVFSAQPGWTSGFQGRVSGALSDLLTSCPSLWGSQVWIGSCAPITIWICAFERKNLVNIV